MFFSSVAMYLTVRKSSLIKTPTYLTNLAMFAIPLVAYLAIGLGGKHAFSISLWQAIVVLVVAVFFSYGGNTVSLKAIDIAPNPGYSLVLSKSYVLFTTLFAVAFLHGELTLRKAVAILIIVGFSALIMVNRKAAKRTSHNKWIVLSFAAFFAWGFLSLSSKYLFSHGVDTISFLIYIYAVVSLCIVLANKVWLRSFGKITPQKWALLAATGVFSTLFNLGNFEAIRLAPNVGYVNAINAASISLVTILAVVLFKDELTRQKAVGIIGVTAGLCLLLL